jgi:hypothetical protein
MWRYGSAYAHSPTVAKRVTAKRRPKHLDRVRTAVLVLRRIVEQLHDASTRFRDLHRRGTEALRARDYRALTDVIALERTLIRRQHSLIERSGQIFQRRIAHLPRWRRATRSAQVRGL